MQQIYQNERTFRISYENIPINSQLDACESEILRPTSRRKVSSSSRKEKTQNFPKTKLNLQTTPIQEMLYKLEHCSNDVKSVESILANGRSSKDESSDNKAMNESECDANVDISRSRGSLLRQPSTDVEATSNISLEQNGVNTLQHNARLNGHGNGTQTFAVKTSHVHLSSPDNQKNGLKQYGDKKLPVECN